jgi:hypothetical protein
MEVNMKICMYCGEPCLNNCACADCWLYKIKREESEEKSVMNRKELMEIMERNNFFESEIDSAIDFIEDMLVTLANKIEKNEPYAVNTIKHMRTAAKEVRDLECAIWEAMENDEEE